jgi:predicted GNAT family N-acyltransferase
MIFREISFGSSEYDQECALRHQVLRVPLGLSLWDEDLGDEAGQFHFGLFHPEGEILACVLAVPLSPASMKIRQMAVSPLRQSMGLGRMLMEKTESHLGALGIVHFTLHARADAVGFYQKLGYAANGGEFIEVGIPHFKMEKTRLSPSTQIQRF